MKIINIASKSIIYLFGFYPLFVVFLNVLFLNRASFASSFPIYVFYISFCLTKVARNPVIVSFSMILTIDFCKLMTFTISLGYFKFNLLSTFCSSYIKMLPPRKTHKQLSYFIFIYNESFTNIYLSFNPTQKKQCYFIIGFNFLYFLI
jgi:hypothetical protein